MRSDAAQAPTRDGSDDRTVDAPTRKHWWRGPIGLGLRLGIAAGAIYYLSTIIDMQEVPAAMGRLDARAATALVGLNFLMVYLGVVRWRLLLRSFGASRIPSRLGLYKLYLVGLFYNTFVPGGLGGDLVRGIASRQAFGAEGRAQGLVVVLVERVLGLCGLLVVVAAATLLHPLAGVPALAPFAALALVGAAGAVAAMTQGPKLARALPGPLAALVAQLPVPRSPAAFVIALLVSVSMHALVAAGGHALVASLAPAVTLLASLAIIPLSSATVFLPVSISGVGFFEAAFVTLYALVDVREHDALAACLGFRLCYLVVAGCGGLLAVVGKPLEYEDGPADASADRS